MTPSIVQSPSDHDRLLITGEFPGFAPQILFDYWIWPELICRWWPQMAEIDPRPGGIYRLSWPQMNWVLNGRVTECVPGQLLSFSWQWEHEPQAPQRLVRVTIAPRPAGGSILTIEHTCYTDSADDQQEREGHREGWLHFLQQLSTLQP